MSSRSSRMTATRGWTEAIIYSTSGNQPPLPGWKYVRIECTPWSAFAFTRRMLCLNNFQFVAIQFLVVVTECCAWSLGESWRRACTWGSIKLRSRQIPSSCRLFLVVTLVFMQQRPGREESCFYRPTGHLVVPKSWGSTWFAIVSFLCIFVGQEILDFFPTIRLAGAPLNNWRHPMAFCSWIRVVTLAGYSWGLMMNASTSA